MESNIYNTLKRCFPKGNNELYDAFMWCATPYPCSKEEDLVKSIEDAALKSGNDIVLAIHLAHEEFEEVMDRARIHDLMVEYLNKCNHISPKCLQLATLSVGYDDLTKEQIEESPIVFCDDKTNGLGLINGFMDHINMPRIAFHIEEDGKIVEIK